MYPSPALDDGSTTSSSQRARVGATVRAARLRRGVSVRHLARQLDLSASFVSQIENGRSSPSVATLRRISTLLGVTLDGLLGDEPVAGSRDRHVPTTTSWCAGALAAGVALTGDAAGGLAWRRLGADLSGEVDVRLLRDSGHGTGTTREPLTRHSGTEYGYVVRGALEVVVGFETHILRAGDTVAFDAARPHRVVSTGDPALEAVWFVHDSASPPRPA